MTVTISQIEKIEFDLVDALVGLPAAEQRLQTKVRDMLAKVRGKKRELLALAPDVLRKAVTVGRSAPAEPRWVGLPCVEPEATEMVKAARDPRSSGSRRPLAARDIGRRSMTLREQAIVGDRNLIAFLNRRVGADAAPLSRAGASPGRTRCAHRPRPCRAHGSPPWPRNGDFFVDVPAAARSRPPA